MIKCDKSITPRRTTKVKKNAHRCAFLSSSPPRCKNQFIVRSCCFHRLKWKRGTALMFKSDWEKQERKQWIIAIQRMFVLTSTTLVSLLLLIIIIDRLRERGRLTSVWNDTIDLFDSIGILFLTLQIPSRMSLLMASSTSIDNWLPVVSRTSKPYKALLSKVLMKSLVQLHLMAWKIFFSLSLVRTDVSVHSISTYFSSSSSSPSSSIYSGATVDDFFVTLFLSPSTTTNRFEKQTSSPRGKCSNSWLS